MKTVIHIHTNYSHDANTSCEALIETAREQNVDCLAITDHNEIDGALAARDIGGIDVIVGEEITSADGHVIGLFLTSRVPPGLPIEETAERIRAQGGLVLAPHPFSTLCSQSLGPAALRRLLPWLDAVEVCNAQNPLPWEDARASRFARRHRITPYAGSDTHIAGYLAGAYQTTRAFAGAADFQEALGEAELHPGRFGVGYFATMIGRHLWDKVFRQPLPGFGVNVPGRDAGGSSHDPKERNARMEQGLVDRGGGA